MQITAKGATVKIALTQHEGRQMRNAAYLAQRIAANLPPTESTARLRVAAQMILDVANEHTPAQDKLDRQDADVPPAR